ncbi:hypothetical protein [Corynebacterium urealyticum]|uniref:hypothetical protein n=1 Tax=Corynebacterium urealyticum TaxID=43771 RepID=UPI0011E63CA5|nr:hypothetical protein [Corynebacterium urealyticum]TYR16566.1 hypothetical protein FYJ89_09180 [Corynebacterium urealyticum]TYR17598.1 hypothetical protein FYJ88_01755 [Corynebacterium urealyticum]TYT20548.1 hypothetical protein FYJ86_07375 [Corynebacterium urealyticum]
MKKYLLSTITATAVAVSFSHAPAASAKPVSVTSQQDSATAGYPSPTQEQIDEIHQFLGDDAVNEFMQAQVEASQGFRIAPVIAGVAVAAVAWCASGALSSLPTSALTDIINRGEGGGDYVQNAIVGCLVGNVGSLAWKALPKSVKQKIYSAVVRFYLSHIRKK